MRHRAYQRRQVKCNFCFEWFSPNLQASSLNLCQECIQKAQTTNCFKIRSPVCEKYYQLILVPKNIQNYDDSKNQIFSIIDKTCLKQINAIIEKWKIISQFLQSRQQWFNQDVQKVSSVLIASSPPSNTQKIIKKLSEILDINYNKIDELNQNQLFKNQILKVNKSTMTDPCQSVQKNQISSEGSTKISNKRLNISIQNYQGISSNKNQSLKQIENISQYFNLDLSSIAQNRKTPKIKTDGSQSTFNWKSKRQKNPYHSLKEQTKNKILEYLNMKSEVSSVLYRIITQKTFEALSQTNTLNNCIQLVAHKINDIDILCYLNMLDFSKTTTLKLVKVGLIDQNFKQVLQFIKDKKIQTLVVSNNFLTEQSCNQLLSQSKNLINLKNIYIANNLIQGQKIKSELKDLRDKFTIYH